MTTHHVTDLERITDDVDELVNGTTTTETVDRLTPTTTGWRKTTGRHTVHHPPLLAQLREAMQASTLTSDDTYRAAFASKPSARLDAIATLARIDTQSTVWARNLGSRWKCPLEDRLRGLVGAAAALPRVDQHQLASDLRSWRTAARVVSGIDSPAFAPDVACPNLECEKRGTLRVRFDLRVASCVECGAYWDPEHVEQLARTVAWSAEHLQGARHWLYDAEGYPTECTECLDTRRAMAERVVGRASRRPARAHFARGA